MYIGGTMEVYTQICGLVILLLIIVFCILKGRDKFSYGRFFTLNIIVAIVSLILDMVSSNLVYNAAFLPEKLVMMTRKTTIMRNATAIDDISIIYVLWRSLGRVSRNKLDKNLYQ